MSLIAVAAMSLCNWASKDSSSFAGGFLRRDNKGFKRSGIMLRLLLRPWWKSGEGGQDTAVSGEGISRPLSPEIVNQLEP
jgi:hypothetical protein